MTRTVLEIVQDAAPRCGLTVPDLLFGSADREAVEVRGTIQEAAQSIVRDHDWSLLKTVETYTGDGTTSAFALPADYLRMPKDAMVWSSRWQRPLLPTTPEEDLRLAVREYDLVTGTWHIAGGNMNFRPALVVGETAKWYYISNLAVSPDSGPNKARFTADTDIFRLDDRLLELEFMWRWRSQKGLAYEEEMRDAEIAKSQQITADGGAAIITQSSRRNVRAKVAYPWNIVP